MERPLQHRLLIDELNRYNENTIELIKYANIKEENPIILRERNKVSHSDIKFPVLSDVFHFSLLLL